MNIFGRGIDPLRRIGAAGKATAKIGVTIGKGIVNVADHAANAARKAGGRIARNINRPKTPFNFGDGISQDEFAQMADRAAQSIKRARLRRCVGPVAHFTVRSQSGISDWRFSVDFNAWGHFTSEYWIDSENLDSKIPKAIAERISDEIKEHLA